MVIDLDRRNPIVRVNRGLVYLARKDSEKAIADFTEAIRINPDGVVGCAVVYLNRGIAHRELGNDVKAAADFAKAKELGCTLWHNCVVFVPR